MVAVGLLIGGPTRGDAQDGEAGQALQRHIQQAVSAVRAENFESAAEHYLAAHAISPRPLLLYNAAYALGRAGRLKRALDVSARASEEGLEENKAVARNRARRTGWSTALQARERAEEAKQTAEVRPPSGTRTAGRQSGPPTLEWLGAGTMVAGGGMLVGAALLDAQIGREAERLRAARREDDPEAWDRALTNIESLQDGGRILIVGGSALIAGGATLTLWGLLDGNGGDTALVPSIGPDGSFAIQIRGTL